MKLKIFTSITVFIIVVFTFVSLSFKTKENQFQTKILNIWENNKFVKVIDLLEKPYDIMCIIPPYGFKVIDNSGSKEVLKINKYLNKNNYQTDEYNWALVILNNNNIELFEFDRGEIEIVLPYKEKDIPKGVTAKNCIKLENGYFYLFTEKDRKHIILGDKK